MSSETTEAGGDRPGPARMGGLFRRTTIAVRGALGRGDGMAVFAVSVIAYFATLETVATNLGAGDGSVDLVVVEEPLAIMFDRIAPFQFEPIALVSLGPVEYLFSPVTAVLSGTVAVLVGVNLAVSWVVWRGPQACHVNPGVGLVAGLPGFLSGFVCCGPTVLLVVGVQASAGLVAAFQWGLPVAVAGLVASLLWVGRQVEP